MLILHLLIGFIHKYYTTRLSITMNLLPLGLGIVNKTRLKCPNQSNVVVRWMIEKYGADTGHIFILFYTYRKRLTGAPCIEGSYLFKSCLAFD